MFSWLKKLKEYFWGNEEEKEDFIYREVSFQEYKRILKSSNDLDKIEEVTIIFSNKKPGKGKVELKLEKPEQMTKRVVHKDKPINMRQPEYEDNDLG